MRKSAPASVMLRARPRVASHAGSCPLPPAARDGARVAVVRATAADAAAPAVAPAAAPAAAAVAPGAASPAEDREDGEEGEAQGPQGAEKSAGDPLHREPQGDVLAPAARRAGQAGQGQPEALRSLPPLPPHREEARDEPAAHAPALSDGPPLARAPRRGRVGLSQPDGRQEPAQPAHEGAGLRFPRRGREDHRAARLPAQDLRKKSASATTRTRRSCTSTCARTGRRSGSTTRARASARSTRRIPSEDLRTGRADTYRPTKIDESWAADDTSMPGENAAKTAPPKDEAQASEPPK